MRDLLLLSSAAVLVLTGAAHSVLGERKLIGPALADRSRIYANHLARAVTRFAWHGMTASWLVIAAMMMIVLDAGNDALVRGVGLIVGIGFSGAGLVDAVMSRGRHIGWPMLTAVGALSLASLLV